LPGAPSNRIFTFAWDADDRLRAVREGTPDRFLAKYDEDGLRRWTSEGWSLPTGQPVVNEYTWGPGGMVHSSNPNTLYVLGTGRRSNGQYRWFQLDWLGSTRSLTDAAGNTTSEQRYEAFGSRTSKTGTDPFHPTDFQWGGAWGYQTETAFSNEPGLGLVYMEQRYYDPLVGRFLSPDPIGHAGGLNLYSYVGNDPVNLVDPSGLMPKEGEGIWPSFWRFVTGDTQSMGREERLYYHIFTLTPPPPHPNIAKQPWYQNGQRAADWLAEGASVGMLTTPGVGMMSVGKMGGAPAAFKATGAKFDWFHIIDRHAPWGLTAQHRIATGSTKTVFLDITKWQQLRNRVQSAWKYRKLVERQWDPSEMVYRLRFRGKDLHSGQTVEFWFNERTRLVESAYPVFP
jgi:RHS repeat-associated protein